MKTALHILLWLLLTSYTLSAEELKTRSLFNDKVELKIPEHFKIMNHEMLKLKYPPENGPALVYTDEAGETNIAMRLLASKADQAQLESYKDNFVASFRKSFPTAEWKSQGIIEINGRKVGYMELITEAIDTKVYNLMFFTNLDGHLLLCTFNCVIRDIEKWQVQAKEIMHSLHIK
jgi:hypothetical protein